MPPATTRDDGSITTEGSGSLRSTHTQRVLCHPGKNLLRGHTTAKMVFTQTFVFHAQKINTVLNWTVGISIKMIIGIFKRMFL